jgi:acetyl esterase/lipase
VVSSNYRLHGEAPFPASLYDGKAVIRWLRAHAAEYHIDADHIGVWGHSAGACMVDWLGAANGQPTLEGDEGNLNFSSDVQAACAWSGGMLPLDSGKPTALKYIDGTKSAPFLLMHGAKDPVVPISLDQLFAKGLVDAGVECSFIPVPGAGHGIGGPRLEKQVIAFFDRYLKPEPAAGIIEQTNLPR